MGLEVYPSTNHDVIVARWKDSYTDRYVFLRYDENTLGGTPREKPSRVPPTFEYGSWVNHVINFFCDPDGSGGILVDETDTYETFEALLADWPHLSSQPVWSTTKTEDRLAYERAKHDRYVHGIIDGQQDGRNGLKTLIDLEQAINSGRHAYARGDHQGQIFFYLTGPGKYLYDFDYCKIERRWVSEKEDAQTAQGFIESILALPVEEDDELDTELRSYLTRPVWSAALDPYCHHCNEILGEGVETCEGCGNGRQSLATEDAEDAPFHPF